MSKKLNNNNEVHQIEAKVLGAINGLEKNLKQDLSLMEGRLDNKAQERLIGAEKRLGDKIHKQLNAMEKRLDNKSKARFETLMATTTLHKLEFVTRQEFEKLKKQVQRLRAN